MIPAQSIFSKAMLQTVEVPRIRTPARIQEIVLTDEVIVLKDSDVTIHVCSGAVWISHDDRELFAFAGDSLYIPKSGDGVTLSPILKADAITIRVVWH